MIQPTCYPAANQICTPINLKTAKALGEQLSPSFIAQVDKVVE